MKLSTKEKDALHEVVRKIREDCDDFYGTKFHEWQDIAWTLEKLLKKGERL